MATFRNSLVLFVLSNFGLIPKDIVYHICKLYKDLGFKVCSSYGRVYISENDVLHRIDNFGDNKILIYDVQNILMMDEGYNYLAALSDEGLYVIDLYETPRFETFLSTADLNKIGINKIKKISCGHDHMLIITDNGLYGNGSNYFDELGYNGLNSNGKLRKIPNCENVIDVICGYHCSLLKKDDNEWYMCGHNNGEYLKYGSNKTLSKSNLKYCDNEINNIINVYFLKGLENIYRAIIHTKDGLFYSKCGKKLIKLNFDGNIDKICFVPNLFPESKIDIMILSNKKIYCMKNDLYKNIVNECLVYDDSGDIIDISCSKSFFTKVHDDHSITYHRY